MLSNGEIWTLWNSQGVDEMNQKEADAFARAIEAKVLEKLQAQSEPVQELASHYCHLMDNLGDLPIPNLEEWAAKQYAKGHELLKRNNYFRAPVQAQSEPVAWMTPMGNVFAKHQLTEAQKADLHPLYTHPAPVQQEQAHTDHPARHYDRTCAACQDDEYRCGGPDCDGKCCQPVQQEPVRNEHMTQRIVELQAQNKQLLATLIDIAYGLEGARIWGGSDWTYNPLHPFKYLPLRDKARAAIAAVEGKA